MSSSKSSTSNQGLLHLLSSSSSSSGSDGSSGSELILGRPPLLRPKTTAELIDKYTAPSLTFGLEFEFDICVLKDQHKEWTQEENNILNNPYLSYSERAALRKKIIAKEEFELQSFDTNSHDQNVTFNMLQYLEDYLNYRLPGQEDMVSVLGDVEFGNPKTLAADKWHLTFDTSLNPNRAGIEGADIEDADEKKMKYRVAGAELVSKVLRWDEEATWMKMIEQLSRDFDPSNTNVWGYFDKKGSEALHVHFGILGDEVAFDSPLGLKVMKNLLALYGLFEDQIEKYVPFSQRADDNWCPRLRLGMEKTKREKRHNTAEQYVATEKPKRYTPEEFTEGIYACNSLEELKTFVTGEPMGGKWKDGSEREVRQSINYTTVNISLRRENKPTTVEFRHQKGTLDPSIIYHWVKFCGTMLQTAWIYAKQDFEFRDGPEVELWQEQSFLRQFAPFDMNAEGILDVVNLPERWKAALVEEKTRHTADPEHNPGSKNSVVLDAWRLYEAFIIRMRSERRVLNKERTGALIDAEIQVELSSMNETLKDAIEAFLLTPDQRKRVIERKRKYLKDHNLFWDGATDDDIDITWNYHSYAHQHDPPKARPASPTNSNNAAAANS